MPLHIWMCVCVCVNKRALVAQGDASEESCRCRLLEAKASRRGSQKLCQLHRVSQEPQLLASGMGFHGVPSKIMFFLEPQNVT